jgi:hypothetical protein
MFNQAGLAGNVVAGGRMYFPSSSQAWVRYDCAAAGGSQCIVYFYPDGTVGYMLITPLGGEGVVRNTNYRFPKDEWFDFRFEIEDTEKRYYQFYINGACLSKDGALDFNGLAYPTPYGVEYRYFGDSTRVRALNGYSIVLEGANKTTDSVVYLDDLYMAKRVSVNAQVADEMNAFQKAFLSVNNIYAQSEDLILPAPVNSAVSVRYTTSAFGVISDAGKVTRGEKDEAVTFTAIFSLSGAEARCPFKINVVSKGAENLTDLEAAGADLFEIISGIKDSCNLNNITQSLTFKTAGPRGTAAAYESSNAAVLADDGTVRRQTADTTVTVKVVVSRNGESATETLTFIVKAASPSAGGGGAKGGGGYGLGSIGVSGVDVDAVFAKPVFGDVDEKFCAYGAIQRFARDGVIEGGGGSFAPDNPVTREEFAKLIAGALNLKATGEGMTFADVSPSDWYYDCIGVLSANGVAEGMGDGTFGVGARITRQDLAVMIYRVCGKLGVGLTPVREYVGFADDGEISGYARDAVRALYRAGVINGVSDGIFAPEEQSTRAQAVYILDKINKELCS